VTPHKSTSFDPTQWKDPETFNPDRYNTALTSQEINNAKCDQTGFARCPFESTTFEVKDGRAPPTASLMARPSGPRPCRRTLRLRLPPLPR
jgi:cytochrome P450